MKVRNVGFPMVFLISAIMILVGAFVGYLLASNPGPKNCAELGATYLEIGKKDLGITDFGSDEWKRLIDDETKFTNDCYKSINK